MTTAATDGYMETTTESSYVSSAFLGWCLVTGQEDLRLEVHRLHSNLLTRQERVFFPVIPYGAWDRMDILNYEL